MLGQCNSEASALSAQCRASPAVFSAQCSVRKALCVVWLNICFPLDFGDATGCSVVVRTPTFGFGDIRVPKGTGIHNKNTIQYDR